jgi:subtilisin family serine protease
MLVLVGALALTLPATAATAATNGDTNPDPAARFETTTAGTGRVSSSFVAKSANPARHVSVIVQMTGDPVAVVQAQKGRKLTGAERSAIKKQLKSAQDGITGAIRAKGGTIQSQMQSAYNGLQATIPANQVDAVAALPGVQQVYPATTHTLDNTVSVPFLGIPAVWQDTGYTGDGVKVAVIDTGIDYTHADFGGPGTVAAYDAAHAAEAQPADPALFGPAAARVKGGTDLVGDDYDADDPASVPKPDPNPLDCNGHGSHVAGTAAGSGVNADGSTYTGPYDASTPSRSFKVGPGVAPKADLYAVRVFGCNGSTNVVVPAIDWAVDHGMNVINMSLGSSFGRADDPDAQAASNAVAAGVVVVTSSGNSGPSPYLTGSPGVGDGVVTVAAVDSTPSFPGAAIAVGGTTLTAINANGADLSDLPAMTVVVLKDDPATPDNEALGCSVTAYEKAGVVEGGGQLAVSQRGTCARVAKAIFAQQAGASAALMVNNTNALPPFEGPITENPDNGTPFTVTIPFLGVSMADGPALAAAAGTQATITPQAIQNPSFRRYADFSSSGPRSGDSAIAPDVAAPGVSIASAGVGTGSGSAVLSGTSMASPHVAGVAALTVQAHPGWSAVDVASLLQVTADPTKVVGQDNTRGGVGLVDAAAAVAGTVTASSDTARTPSGKVTQPTVSFGFDSSTGMLRESRAIQLTNHGTTAMTYQVSTAATGASKDATVTVSPSRVTVRPGKTASVTVTLTADARTIGSSLADNAFYEISGDIVFTAPSSTLRVPYLLVPRADANVTSTSTGRWFVKDAATKGGTYQVALQNKGGALDASADFYTWGLSRSSSMKKGAADPGLDLRAAGVQSFGTGSSALYVFAVSMHSRWSNPAAIDVEIPLDFDHDGTADRTVIVADNGLVTTGSVDGVDRVFVLNNATGALFATNFLPQAPTDSSTMVIPVFASSLQASGAFDYTVGAYSITDNSVFTEFSGTAAYDPAAPGVENGQFGVVPVGGTASFGVTVDPAAFRTLTPRGTMIVVPDNTAGAGEAILLEMR